MQENENLWIASAQKGDLDAFNHLVTLYQDRVFQAAYRILGSYDDADDAAQQAFISAYRNINAYRGGSFKAWLLRTTVYACYDELRRGKRRRTVSIDTDPEDDDINFLDSGLPDPSPSPRQISEARELNRAIQHCLQGLPAEFRAVAVLADVEEMEYEEISRITGSPMGTIKSRLARARQKLRACLEDFWELLPPVIRQKYEDAR